MGRPHVHTNHSLRETTTEPSPHGWVTQKVYGVSISFRVMWILPTAYELGSGMKVFLTAFFLKFDGPVEEVVIEVKWRCAECVWVYPSSTTLSN
jgi:hypothetical protein